jgi:peptide chain release factor subunit 1
MDGNGSLFATLNGNHREILHKMSVELPKKHGTPSCTPLPQTRARQDCAAIHRKLAEQ